MTTLADVTYALLVDGGTIQAVFGTRWTPGRLPETTTYPAGAYQRVAGPGEHTHSGRLANHERRVQLSIYDTDYSRGEEARATVVAALDGTRKTAAGFEVTIRKADDAEDIDPEPAGLYRQRVDLYLRTEAP